MTINESCRPGQRQRRIEGTISLSMISPAVPSSAPYKLQFPLQIHGEVSEYCQLSRTIFRGVTGDLGRKQFAGKQGIVAQIAQLSKLNDAPFFRLE